MKDCMWIGVEHADAGGRFAYFRLDFQLSEVTVADVEITAAARYRLWANGQPVCSGPCTGDTHVWYFDRIDLTDYLRKGRNCLAVQVICLDHAKALYQTSANASLFRATVPDHRHRLAFSGRIGGIDLSTGKADWRVMLDESTYLSMDRNTENLGAYPETVDFRQTPADWKTGDCTTWVKADVLDSLNPGRLETMFGVGRRYTLAERPIPMPFEREELFVREIMTKTGLLEKESASVPPNTAFECVLDAGQIKMTRPAFSVSGGRNGVMRITYFEKFQKDGENLRRDDWQCGEIIGITDCVTLDGGSVCYEPFYQRTFRFIRICIETQAEGAVLQLPRYRRTGYPLTMDSHVASSVPWVEQVWRMSIETLQNCMMDTYMDCPYYEQMQYIMDTRLQVLFNLSVSHDTALARKALAEFHRGMLPCGLIQGKYPSAYPQVISTFSLHFVFMVWEYYEHTGDSSVLRAYRADCDRILDYFADHMTQRGLMGHTGFWPFVDWLEAWNETCGMPEALQHGESTIISLMYAYALGCAADINRHSGRACMAEEYESRKQAICDAVKVLCWNEERGMFREGPEFEQYTRHAQAWAVLCDMADESVLKAALENSDVLKVTFATSYEWMRALEKTGLYSYAAEALQAWILLIALDCKTCPETPHYARSDNHAWSALPMLELLRGIAGIQAAEPGWKSVRIAPNLLGLPDLTGTAATPAGDIRFDYTQKQYAVTLPKGMRGTFVVPNGENVPLREGKQIIQA